MERTSGPLAIQANAFFPRLVTDRGGASLQLARDACGRLAACKFLQDLQISGGPKNSLATTWGHTRLHFVEGARILTNHSPRCSSRINFTDERCFRVESGARCGLSTNIDERGSSLPVKGDVWVHSPPWRANTDVVPSSATSNTS